MFPRMKQPKRRQFRRTYIRERRDYRGLTLEQRAARLDMDRQKMASEDRHRENDVGLKRESMQKDAEAKGKPSAVVQLGGDEVSKAVEAAVGQMSQTQQALVESQHALVEALSQMAAAMSAPKRLIRDQNGRPAGVETVGA